MSEAARSDPAYEEMIAALRQVVAIKRIGDPLAFIAEISRVQKVCAAALASATRPLARMEQRNVGQ